jgi:SAM-dependent methyltransferase
MSKGWWGGKFPIINLFCSKFIFASMRYRILTCRLKNSFREKKAVLVNESSTALVLRTWLDNGFNKLNVGGGSKNLEGFVNIDFVRHPTAEREVIANILDLSFVPSNSMSHIHCNHVIEHLTEEQLRHQILDYRRILKDNGCLTIRCPNSLGASFGFWFEPVLEQNRNEFIALGYPPDESFGNPEDKWLHKDLFGLLHWFYGDMGNIENQHFNIITPSKLKRYLEVSGFKILKMTEPESINIILVAKKM